MNGHETQATAIAIGKQQAATAALAAEQDRLTFLMALSAADADHDLERSRALAQEANDG